MRYILEFLFYSPRVYSSLDRYLIEAARCLRQEGYRVVFVFSGDLNRQPLLVQDIEDAGGVVEILSPKNGFGEIWRLFRKYNPVLVDVHFKRHRKVVLGLFSLIFRSKYVIHEHSMPTGYATINKYIRGKGLLKRLLFGLEFRLSVSLSDAILCVSDAILQNYKRFCFGNTDKKLSVMYLGAKIVDPKYTKEEARRILGLPQDAIVISNVSAIDPVKGIDVMIRTLAILKERHKNIKFLHIGGLRTDDKALCLHWVDLQRLAFKLDVNENITWAGIRNDVVHILAASDVYVHLSRLEGMGSTILEAMMCSLPVVCANVGGMPEAVYNGVSGYVVEPENPDNAAEAIELILHDRESIGKASRERVVTEFNLNTLAKELENKYITLINE